MTKLIKATISISILFLLSFYIFQVNSLSKEIYLIENYEKQLNQLSEENEALEINFSKVNSLKNIVSYVETQNFERVNKIKYIRILETLVVLR